MIIEFFIDIVCNILTVLFNGIEAVNIPVSGIVAIAEITSYGCYIVGTEFLLVFCGVVSFWMTIKFSIGLSLFVWRLLPLT